MKLENQICSLELARRLKMLGFEQESLFYWVMMYPGALVLSGPSWIIHTADEFENIKVLPEEDWMAYPAYTAAELGEMLPSHIKQHSMFVDRFHDKWLIGYSYVYDDDKPFMNTEADAKAELLIWLKENNLL